ncbi:hypothetical protein NEHOM01_1997 [Nematocida homosporus]|uniref:uncharacterized protein n=1 Tax=Nematocida homosporus TaxID=1912981 RepID=UPI002220CD70|nr:uncharacterized protein NEHOM01_1997 [Nematocida homosporus]KAI5187192.1 hypothetical protein NEHOM01_1997 [Nematocida homosporus]
MVAYSPVLTSFESFSGLPGIAGLSYREGEVWVLFSITAQEGPTEVIVSSSHANLVGKGAEWSAGLSLALSRVFSAVLVSGRFSYSISVRVVNGGQLSDAELLAVSTMGISLCICAAGVACLELVVAKVYKVAQEEVWVAWGLISRDVLGVSAQGVSSESLFQAIDGYPVEAMEDLRQNAARLCRDKSRCN